MWKNNKMDLTGLGYTPKQVYDVLTEMGYSHGDPDYLPYGTVVMEFTKDNSKTVKVWSDAISFELKVTLHEPCNYFIDFY